jgi:hypothetical protein
VHKVLLQRKLPSAAHPPRLSEGLSQWSARTRQTEERKQK